MYGRSTHTKKHIKILCSRPIFLLLISNENVVYSCINVDAHSDLLVTTMLAPVWAGVGPVAALLP